MWARLLVEAPSPAPGLLEGGPAEEAALPEPGEEDEPDQVYDPLPGFEGYA